MLTLVAALFLAAPQIPPSSPGAPPAGTTDIDAQNAPRLDTVAQLLRDHQPDAALQIANTAISSYEADHATEKRRLYCGMSVAESILYAGMAAKDKVDAVVLGPGYCNALYFKGFALIDLGRIQEARATYERLSALAPMHAHFLTELGQLSRLEKNWPVMLETCTRSEGLASLDGPAVEKQEKGFALRCQGYALTELHRYDEAEQRYHDALSIDPNDAKAKSELRYIAEQRAKH